MRRIRRIVTLMKSIYTHRNLRRVTGRNLHLRRVAALREIGGRGNNVGSALRHPVKKRYIKTVYYYYYYVRITSLIIIIIIINIVIIVMLHV